MITPRKRFPRSKVKILVHASWFTKRKQPILSAALSKIIFDHIRQISREKRIYISEINGNQNEVHCSFFLDSTMSVSTALQHIKGESSRWTNLNKLTNQIFDWEDRYTAESIGPSELKQLNHHIQSGTWSKKKLDHSVNQKLQ